MNRAQRRAKKRAEKRELPKAPTPEFAAWEDIVAAMEIPAAHYLRGDRVAAVAAWRDMAARMPYVPRPWAGILSYGDATLDEAAQGHYFCGLGAPSAEDPYVWTWRLHDGTELRGRLAWRIDEFPGIDLFDLTFLAMGLGYWYERRGDYASAAWAFEVRHGLFRQAYPWHPEPFHEAIDLVGHNAIVSDLAGDADETRLVFLVGVPRCGSTIVSRALASHPDVVEIGENPMFDEALRAATVDGIPDLARARELVTEAIAKVVGMGAPRLIVNKQLNNWLWAPLIWRMFPRARFVELRRDPIEHAISCWRTDFSVSSMSWASSMEGIATYMRVADHAVSSASGIAPEAWRSLDFDELTEHPGEMLRDLCAWLELPWEDAVLHPERRGANVIDTASTFSAREPIKPQQRWANRYPEQAAAFVAAFGDPP